MYGDLAQSPSLPTSLTSDKTLIKHMTQSVMLQPMYITYIIILYLLAQITMDSSVRKAHISGQSDRHTAKWPDLNNMISVMSETSSRVGFLCKLKEIFPIGLVKQ